MESPCTPAAPKRTRTLRQLMLAALGLWLFCAGGCAMLPFAITTTASMAMPATASLAMTGVKGAYTTAYLASDERDMNTIVRDNMLSLKAKSALLAAHGSGDVQAQAFNGEVFVVGVVETQADRDAIILAMQSVKGVGSVKGYIRLRDAVSPARQLADGSLENSARMSLSRYMLHKNSGIEVKAVQGELCLMGVVGTHAEALDLIQYVESVTGARARSLLAIRDEYATGHTQTNKLYLLESSVATPTPRGITLQDDPHPLPNTPIFLTKTSTPAPRTIRAASIAPAPTWNKARASMQQRLTGLAKHEPNPLARAELLTLATQIAQDRDLSISDRLSVAADKATQQQAKTKIQALLALF